MAASRQFDKRIVTYLLFPEIPMEVYAKDINDFVAAFLKKTNCSIPHESFPLLVYRKIEGEIRWFPVILYREDCPENMHPLLLINRIKNRIGIYGFNIHRDRCFSVKEEAVQYIEEIFLKQKG